MRYFVGLVLALALSITGCSETSGTGGWGGAAGVGAAGAGGDGGAGGDPFPGNCGYQGQGGGSAWIYPGLYRALWDDDSATYQACVYVNEDCTELKPSTECNIGEDDSQDHFLEIEWTVGRNENGEECAADVGVTTDLAARIPINAWISGPSASFSFYINFSDDDGSAWEIRGTWSYDNLILTPRRTTDDVVCRPHVDYPNSIWCSFADSWDLCLDPG